MHLTRPQRRQLYDALTQLDTVMVTASPSAREAFQQLVTIVADRGWLPALPPLRAAEPPAPKLQAPSLRTHNLTYEKFFLTPAGTDHLVTVVGWAPVLQILQVNEPYLRVLLSAQGNSLTRPTRAGPVSVLRPQLLATPAELAEFQAQRSQRLAPWPWALPPPSSSAPSAAPPPAFTGPARRAAPVYVPD